MSHTVYTHPQNNIFRFAAETRSTRWVSASQTDETGRQSRTHLEELGVGDDEDDDRDNVGGGDGGDDDCGCDSDSDSDWQEAEVTLLPREETGVLRLL